MQGKPIQLLTSIAQVIYDKKGLNILVLDVREVSTLTDYFVIAEGQVDRHVKAIAAGIAESLKQQGESLLHSEGEEQGDWIVLDYGGVIIHLFLPKLRNRYSLEELWRDGKVVDVDIVTAEES